MHLRCKMPGVRHCIGGMIKPQFTGKLFEKSQDALKSSNRILLNNSHLHGAHNIRTSLRTRSYIENFSLEIPS